MHPLFKATARFDTADGTPWQGYFDWAKIPALTEVVGAGNLNECIVEEYTSDDWNHVVQIPGYFGTDLFDDVHFLLKRVVHVQRRNILGLYRNPESHIAIPPAEQFEFLGYDLVDDTTGISALTNCGGFPESFSNGELNNYGLLPSFAQAADVKSTLERLNPEEHHAKCEMYAIWRLVEH